MWWPYKESFLSFNIKMTSKTLLNQAFQIWFGDRSLTSSSAINNKKYGYTYELWENSTSERVGSARNKFFPVTILIKLRSVLLTFWIHFIRNSNQWRIFVKTIVKFPISQVCEILDSMSNCQFGNKKISSRS